MPSSVPELPDVEVFRRYLEETALHQRIERVEVLDADLLEGVTAEELDEALAAKELTATRRHGKWLFAGADHERWLAIHFGMTGGLAYEGAEPPEHTRVLLHFANGSHLAYHCQRKFGRVTLTDDPDAFVDDRELGPDALRISCSEFEHVLDDRRGTLKALLMNQAALAGIGNIYADEILYQAKLHPESPISELETKDRVRLYRHMRRVLETAIDRRADPTRFPRTWLTPHRDEEGTCPRCGEQLRTTEVSGRTSRWCPGCQRSH
jgi:formamidopyrimidine-DNA glycosylase